MSTPLFLFLGDLGGGEIMLILVVILIFFGANKIPELARGLGKGIREFKDASNEIRSEIENAGLPKQNQQSTAYTAPAYDVASQQPTITSVSSVEPVSETNVAPPMDGGIAPSLLQSGLASTSHLIDCPHTLRRFNSLTEVRDELTAGTTTCRQLVEYYLDNIQKQNHLNAFLEVFTDEALAQADAVDAKLVAGRAGKLAGMVIGLKDVLAYKDHSLQSSSHILDGFKSLYTGTAVQRLLDADAIIIGRQNCDEFAMGASNETSYFGPARNAIDPDRVPGGSSGGSAVAVQADLCLASIGSDTGGSVRQPAAFCGIVGFKPTYSRISRYGLVAYASSFDQIGTLTHSVDDAALLLEVMAGPDNFDSTVSQKPVPAYSELLAPAPHVRIGYIRDCMESPGLNPEIKAATETALDVLRGQGHVVEEVDFPYLDYIVPSYYILTTAEASSNLSRYDGVKFGYRASDATDLESLYKKTRAQGFGPEVQRRILLGTFVLSADYYDAYYTKAQRVRRLIKEKTDELLRQYDFLILPTTPTTAFQIGENERDTLAMYLADIFTVQASLAGVPAVSVPAGHDAAGLPIGLQILSGAFREEHLLAFAKSVMESLTPVLP